jgi:alpha-tubulin suppressor-like RCC1 family protein
MGAVMHVRSQPLAATIAALCLIACGDDPSTLACPAGKTCGFTQISGGFEHTCAIYSVVAGSDDDYGQVVCWGENRDGRCGAASGVGEAQAKQAVVVADIRDAIAVSAGGTQTCALRASGKVACWGGNAFGELGDGEEDGSFAPVEPLFSVQTREIEQIAVGGSSLGGTSCARDNTHKLWCWGRNHEQQVRPAEVEIQNAPVQIQGVDAAADLSIGQDFVCSIIGGQLRCWGNGFGSAPSSILSVTNPIIGSLSSKGFMTCVRSASDVQCFTNFDDRVSTPIAGALQVATGAQHTCALRSTRDVVCWGSASNGRLGLGSDIHPDDPTNELSLTNVVLENANGDALTIEQIASGASHSCALDSAHDIYCWGDNSRGQLGDGTETSRSAPTLLQLQP